MFICKPHSFSIQHLKKSLQIPQRKVLEEVKKINHYKCKKIKIEIYTTIWKFGLVFERSLFCSPRLHIFDQDYGKNSKNVKYYYDLK